MSEALFDYGKNLLISSDDLALIHEVEVVWDDAEYIGSVVLEDSAKQRLYRVNDEVVKLRPVNGFEG